MLKARFAQDKLEKHQSKYTKEILEGKTVVLLPAEEKRLEDLFKRTVKVRSIPATRVNSVRRIRESLGPTNS